MRREIGSSVVFLILFAIGFLTMGNVSGETPKIPGVEAGAYFFYSFNATFSSSNPELQAKDAPSLWGLQWDRVLQLDSYRVEVTDVSGTNVTCQMIEKYKNATEIAITGWIDIDDGNDHFQPVPVYDKFLFSANLTQGSSIYSEPNQATVNETISRNYLGNVQLEVNHVNMSRDWASGDTTYSQVMDLYSHKSSGALAELLIRESIENHTYSQQGSFLMTILESNDVPGFSSVLAMSLLVFAALVAVTVFRRKHSRCRVQPQGAIISDFAGCFESRSAF